MQAQDTLSVPSHVMARALGDEVVILDLASSAYFGLNPVGARAWELFGRGETFSQVCEALEREFEVDRSQLEQDIAALVGQLVARGLAAVQTGA